jgi:hypothetical protein
VAIATRSEKSRILLTINLLVSLTGVTFDDLSVNAWVDGTQPGDVNVP